MKLPRPMVVLFGAGATRGAFESISNPPPPLDCDFFDIAGQIQGHGTEKLAKKVLKDVWQLYKKVSGISLESYYRDIETRAMILQFAKAGNKPKDWATRQKNLEELIRRVLIHTTCEAEQLVRVRALKSLAHDKILKLLKKGDTILTFNYDTVIEEAFSNSKLWTPLTGYGGGVKVHGKSHAWYKRWLNECGASSTKESNILLLKLHGSLHWTYYPNAEIRLKPQPYRLRTRNGRPIPETISILPPSWRKEIEKKPYSDFWRTARLKLEGCRTLVIVGYSLPETDLLARAMFSEVARRRAGSKKMFDELHVADPNSQIQQRFVDLFTPALGSTGKICRYNGIKEFADAFHNIALPTKAGASVAKT